MDTHPTDLFYASVLSRGKRWTTAHEVVASIVFSFRQRFEIAEVVDQISNLGGAPRVSRATTYRILDSMVIAGLARRSESVFGSELYENTSRQ
ncbi:MAG TPA: hypothetical protein VGM05_07280 [Planctomycetaceae bacterium]